MKTWISGSLRLISIIVLAALPIAAEAQTIELKSARTGVLQADERERFLAAHNAARKAVGVEPVRWSDELSKYALESLDMQKEQLIADAKEGWDKRLVALPAHRSDPKFGENVAGWAGTSQQPAERAVALWLSEKAAFDKLNADSEYRVGDEMGQTEKDESGQERPIIVGHYTAIVWRDTKEIGAAKLEFTLTDEQGDSRHFVAIVCNYNPPGNRRGSKPY